MLRHKEMMEEIGRVLQEHRSGPFVWGRRDCVTLVEGILGAQGIVVDFRDAEPDIVAGSHSESVRLSIDKHGSLAAMLSGRLDAVPELERVENPFEWAPGMVGMTPDEGEICVGFKRVDAGSLGAVAGVVGLNERPWIMTEDKGMLPVSALWPRWKPRLRLAV